MLKDEILKSSPPVVHGWNVRRRETAAVKVEEILYRALAVKKMEEQNINPLNKSTQKTHISPNIGGLGLEFYRGGYLNCLPFSKKIRLSSLSQKIEVVPLF